MKSKENNERKLCKHGNFNCVKCMSDVILNKIDRKCEDCKAFQPALYLSKVDRCQFNQKIGHANDCKFYCETVEEHIEVIHKKWSVEK